MIRYFTCNTKTILNEIRSQKVCMSFSFYFNLFALISSLTLWIIYVFVLRFFVPFENSSHMETSPMTGEGLHVLANARHLWPLSSEGSLAYHTFCDTGHPFIMVISEDPRHSHLLPSVWQWSCHDLFLWLRSVAAGIRTPNLLLARWTLKPPVPPTRSWTCNW